MPAARPFPHLDALRAIFDRAAETDSPSAHRGVGGMHEGIGRSLFPHPFVTAGALMWPSHHAHRVLHEWAHWTRDVPHDVTSVGRLVRFPYLPAVPSQLRGRSMVVVEVAIPREPWVAAGRLASLRRLEPEMDTVGVVAPDAVHPLHTEVDVAPPAVSGHMPLAGLPAAAIDAFVAIAGPGSGSNLLSAAFRHLGPAYGVAAAGIARSADEIPRLEIRLALLAGRLAPFATGRGAGAIPALEEVRRRRAGLGRN